jgi:predicted permease
MPGYFELLLKLVPVFAAIGCGFFARRVGWLTHAADTALIRLVVDIMYPCFIAQHILGNSHLENGATAIAALSCGFGQVLLGLAVAWLFAHLLRLRRPDPARTFTFTVGLHNYGYLPVPIVAALFDSKTTGVLLMNNAGVELALWTVGILILSGGQRAGTTERPQSRLWRRLLNGPSIAVAACVLINLTKLSPMVPEVGHEALRLIGSGSIVLGLVMTGATLADVVRTESLVASPGVTCLGIGVRLGVLPPLILAVAFALPLPLELRQVLAVEAAMPCAMIPIILSKRHGTDSATAVRLVVWSTLASLLIIPLWIKLGLHWLATP